MLNGNANSRWKKLFKQRDPVFREVANVHVHTRGLTPQGAAKKVIDMVSERAVHVTGAAIEPYDAVSYTHLPELTFAHPAGNIHVAGDYFFAIDEVLNVIEDEHVDHVIVGLPLQMDGTEGKSAKKARRWAANLEKRLQAESEDSDSTAVSYTHLNR